MNSFALTSSNKALVIRFLFNQESQLLKHEFTSSGNSWKSCQYWINVRGIELKLELGRLGWCWQASAIKPKTNCERKKSFSTTASIWDEDDTTTPTIHEKLTFLSILVFDKNINRMVFLAVQSTLHCRVAALRTTYFVLGCCVSHENRRQVSWRHENSLLQTRPRWRDCVH